MPAVIALCALRQLIEVVRVGVCDESVNAFVVFVIFGIIIFIDFGFFFDEGIQAASSSSLAWAPRDSFIIILLVLLISFFFVFITQIFSFSFVIFAGVFVYFVVTFFWRVFTIQPINTLLLGDCVPRYHARAP